MCAQGQSIPAEYVAGVNLLFNIGQRIIETIRNDGLAQLFEQGEIVHHTTSEEGGAIFQSRLVDNHLGTLSLDAFHNALNGRLAEIVGIGFHGESVYTNGAGTLCLSCCRDTVL